MYKNIIIGLLAISSFASASNGFKSELSHFIGGALIAMIIAFLIFKYSPKYKAKSVMIGFIISTIYVTIDQSIDYLKDGAFMDQFLDFSVHVVGSIVGAYLISLYLKKVAK